MSARVPYDDFADIYELWCESAPIVRQSLPFYVELLTASEGPVVELGVGAGRICIEAARRGTPVVGVDSSLRMLELCRERAREAGVLERLTLLQADFRDFVLPQPARLAVIPFHSIGHLLDDEDKRRALTQIREQLAPGGRLVFDHFIFDPDYPTPAGVPNLRAESRDDASGRTRLLWDITIRDPERQLLHVLALTEELDEAGVCVERRYRPIDLSWLEPQQTRELLEQGGYEIEALYGDFQRSPFDESSTYQIWFARRPA